MRVSTPPLRLLVLATLLSLIGISTLSALQLPRAIAQAGDRTVERDQAVALPSIGVPGARSSPGAAAIGDHKVHVPLIANGYSPYGWVTLVNERFEGSFPGAWAVLDEDGATNGEYFWAKSGCRASAGSFGGWPVGGGADGGALGCGSNYPNNARAWMIHGPFSLADATDGTVSFKLWLNSETVEGTDMLCRYASVDGTNFAGMCTHGASDGWVDRSLDLKNVYQLGNLTGRAQVWVALVFETNGSTNYPEGAYVDDVVVRKYVPVPGATGSSASDAPADGQGLSAEATEEATPGGVVERPSAARLGK